MKTILAACAAVAMAAATPALAVTPVLTFNTVGNTGVNGTYGNAMEFGPTSTSTLKMSVTAWQSNQSTNAITSAYLGAFSGGLGVTGINDASGANNLHQIDNSGGYTDFVMLEFNRAVTLTSVKTNSYGIGGVVDNDAVWYDASVFVTPTWNSTAGFTGYKTAPDLWTAVGAGASGAARATGAATASTKWLVGAAFTPTTDRNDGFKLSSVSVVEPTSASAVPEPASWAMMIVGVGAAGGTVRRSRRREARAAIA